MHLRAEKYSISLPRPFRIAHGTSATRDTILVYLEDDHGRQAHGEGALPPYYPSNADACLRWVSNCPIGEICAEETLDRQIASLPPAPPEAAAGRVALEIALHDRWAQREHLPLWRLWGLDARTIPQGVRTLSIPVNEQELSEMLAEGTAAGFRHFKLKVGSGDVGWDEEIVRLARAIAPGARLSVDANAAWSTAEAACLIPRLGDCDYVEQPVGAPIDNWRELKQLLKTPTAPLVADESVQNPSDIEALRGLADGVNIKLLKAGGFAGAREWILQAREAGLRVMIGVMVETGIGRTAAAQLAPLADWLDIDPPDAIPMAPLAGCRFEGGMLQLSENAGLGLVPVN